jgi:hypothetical protein
VIHNLERDGHHLVEVFRTYLPLGEFPEALLHVASKLRTAVAVDDTIGVFNAVKAEADFRRAEAAMLQKVREVLKGALKENVVLPERVIRVDDQVKFSVRRQELLPSHKAKSSGAPGSGAQIEAQGL